MIKLQNILKEIQINISKEDAIKRAIKLIDEFGIDLEDNNETNHIKKDEDIQLFRYLKILGEDGDLRFKFMGVPIAVYTNDRDEIIYEVL